MPETETTTRITELGTVGVPVSDQDRALEFYVEKLGFETRIDAPYGEGERWVEVAPPGATTSIALIRAREGIPTGINTQLRLTTANAEADHETFRSLGIDVDPELLRYPVPMFTFRDVDGNTLVLVERPDEATDGDGAGTWESPAQGRGEYAEVNGLRLYYEVHGTGRPLILLHGGLGSGEMFGQNLPALAAGHQVIAVDLQGHGRTADIDRPISPELMADDIAALIGHLKLDRPDVLGYSLGGGVAIWIGIKHPQLVRKLVIVSTNIRRNAQYPEMLEQQSRVGAEAAEAMKETPMYQLYARVAPRPDDWPRLLAKIGDAMKNDFDLSHEVAGIQVPVMVVAGDADIFPPAHAVELFGLLGGGKRDGGWDGSGRPKSRLAILPGHTHYTTFSSPALAAAAIPFLDEDGAA